MRKLIILVIILIAFLTVWSAASKYLPSTSKFLESADIRLPSDKVKVVTEESVVIDVVKKVTPSVVTVAEELPTQSFSPFDFGPFSFDAPEEDAPLEPQNIGSGFIVSDDGLIVTNKHVVSDVGGKYQVITNDDKKFNVERIYRDPLNDIAILKINASNLNPVELGDSSNLQVGQLVVAIGTPLGRFSNTVTSGIISGLGRGITAGSQFQGFAERLDNVIQTDAAISPGNSGGPLVNSASQVIGVNTAIAQGGQNIGFALPIDVIKDSLKNFNETGQFNRPYLGIAYRMISKDLAIANDVPEGAYVQRIVDGSAASKAGIKPGDIITKIDGQKVVSDQGEVASIISKKKVGDTIKITVWREDPENAGKGKTIDLQTTLDAAPDQ